MENKIESINKDNEGKYGKLINITNEIREIKEIADKERKEFQAVLSEKNNRISKEQANREALEKVIAKLESEIDYYKNNALIS